MKKDVSAVYKLIVLYMLNKVEYPLTKAQVMDFILEREYTNFMSLQAVMCELIDEGMVVAESFRNRTHLKITPDGIQTINFFEKEINQKIREEIDQFFIDNSISIKNEVSIIADYYKATNEEWEAHLIAKDKDINLVDITMSVPLEEMASEICDNWNKKNQEIYQYLVKQLF